MPEDLWPDFKKNEIQSPISILKEQSTTLANKTNNLVEGQIVDTRDPDSLKLEYAFFILAPALGGYRYKLFSISHDIRMYPLSVHLETELYAQIAPAEYAKKGKTANLYPEFVISVQNQDEFKALLKLIFFAKKTIDIVSAILVQSST
jgi:hypothetical protein